MSIVWSVQILASLGFEIYKKKTLENSENRGCHGNGGENQQIFLHLCSALNIKIKNGQSFRKIYFFLFPSHIGRCLIFSESDFLRLHDDDDDIEQLLKT